MQFATCVYVYLRARAQRSVFIFSCFAPTDVHPIASRHSCRRDAKCVLPSVTPLVLMGLQALSAPWQAVLAAGQSLDTMFMLIAGHSTCHFVAQL